MRLGKILTLSTIFSLFSALGWYGYAAFLFAGIPEVEIREVSPLAAQNDKTLPFFELMSPIPLLASEQP